MYEYVGAIHIHSSYSDGTGTIEQIAKAAHDSGVDFIMMTDHNTIQPKKDGYEKFINNVAVIIGYELNDLQNKNHYLVFGTDEVPGKFQKISDHEMGCKLSAAEYVEEVSKLGGIGFIAHPDEERESVRGYKSYPWNAWDSENFTGIEIWNHMSEWKEGITNDNILQRFIHPLKSIVAPSAKTLLRWDILSQSRRITGIGGVDAHAFKQNLLGLVDVEVFPYKVLFKSIRTHILLEEKIDLNKTPDINKYVKSILSALKKCRCFISNKYNGDAKGFRFFVEQGKNVFGQGESLKLNNGNIIARVLTPKTSTIKLIHNGLKVEEYTGMEVQWDIKEKGIYRAECWIKNRGWIFSNHIRIN